MTTFQRTDFSSPLGSKSSDTLLPALAAILMLVATSEQADAQILYVGNGSSDQTTSFTSGTNTYTGAFIGNTSTDSNNTLNVLNPGTRLTINGGNVQVGFAGSGNSMVISNGGFVSDVTGAISFGAGSNNSVLVTGAGSTWSNSNQVRLGVAGQASLTVANEGSVIATGVNGIQVAVSNNSVGVLNIGSFGGSDSAGSIVAPKIAFNSGTGYLNFNQTNTFTLTNAITGGNTIVFQQLGSGTTILTGANSSANSTFISQGTLQIGDGGANGSIGSRAITNNSVLAINSSTNITFGSGKGITGTGVLVQMGTGTTTLNGSNTTYSGGTLISDGTLRVGAGPTGSASDANGSLGTGNVTNNATLLFSRRTASDTVSNNISGTGALTMFGSGGGLTLVGSNSYSGPTTIDSSYTLQIGTGSTNGTLGTGSVSNEGILSFNRSDLYRVTNTISGSGALSQVGTGTTILLGSNSSSGTTTVTNGTLQIGNGGTSGSVGSGAISLSGAGLLAFNRADSVTIANSIGGGGGTLSQIGSGTLILIGSGATYGGTVISNGTLQIGDGGANGSIGAGAITNNSVLAINSSTNITFGSGKGITGTGVLVQMGTGTTTLNGSNTTYSGGTLISAGSLHVGTGANFDSNGSLGTGDVTNNATLAFKRNLASDIVSNNISGTGALTMFGSGGGLTLVGSNSYSGLTTIGSGYTLQIGTGGTNGTLGTGSVSNAGTLSFNRSDLYTASSAISGVGPLRQIGTGTTALSGSNTYTGTTSIGAGTLLFQNKNALYGGDSSLWTAANIIVSNNATAAFGVGGVSGFTTSNVTTLLGNLTAVNNAGLRAGSSIGFDTTADDFILTNNVANSTGAGGGSLGLTKLGLGTLTLSASNNFSGPISVKAGTLALASVTGSAAGSASSVTVTNGATLLVSQSEQVMNSATVTLSGGTIARGSGVSETFGNLSLTEASFFDFGAGTAGRMTFGTYQNNTPPSALLTVNNFLPGNTLVFGSDLTSTITNTSLFQFSGEFTSAWNGGNSTFTITAIPESSTYVAALGLLALCAWPLLRRKRAKIS